MRRRAGAAGAGARKRAPKPKRTQEERRDEAERRLMSAAVRIVAARGLADFTLAEVGQAAGYSRGLAAHYFGSKDGLVAALADRIVEGFGRAVGRADAHDWGLERLLRTVSYYFESAGEDPVGTRALFVVLNAALTTDALKAPMSALNARSVKAFEKNIRAGVAAGDIRRNLQPRQQAILILATLRGAVAQWLVDPRANDLRALRADYIASLRRSLAP